VTKILKLRLLAEGDAVARADLLLANLARLKSQENRRGYPADFSSN